MRSLMLDELTSGELAAIKVWLSNRLRFSGVEGIYWLELPKSLWAEAQRQAQTLDGKGADSFRLAVEVGPSWVRFELLIRSETLANIGGGQATVEQTLFVLNRAEDMAKELSLITCADVTPAESEAGVSR